MTRLLYKALSRSIAPDYTRRFLAAFPVAFPERLTHLKREIAQELSISLNTMRTHTKNIYSKLDVNNRRAALRKSEQLNLL